MKSDKCPKVKSLESISAGAEVKKFEDEKKNLKAVKLPDLCRLHFISV